MSGATMPPQELAQRVSVWRTFATEASVEPPLKGLDRAWHAVAGSLRRWRTRSDQYLREAQLVIDRHERVRDLHASAFAAHISELRADFRRGRVDRARLHEALACVREAGCRALGLEAYPVQIAGALALSDGLVAELATGEGKTLVASLAATVRGWRGRGCHVITVNDYLASRDAKWMLPLYELCHVSVGVVVGTDEPANRRAAYAADVTYSTNKEVAADFLRDRLTLAVLQDRSDLLLDDISSRPNRGPMLLQRGLESAIVDEADAVLVDEAVTPLIISGRERNDDLRETSLEADRIARELEADQDFRIESAHREIRLTRRGRDRIKDTATGLDGVWSGDRRAEELVVQSLTAHHLHHSETHYVVRENRVVIVDEFTGRLMPDRTWRAGLHQAIEAKEGLEVQPPKDTYARISFQRFFGGYRTLAGMSGTAWEARGELWARYRVPVVRIPTHRPVQREIRAVVTQANSADRDEAVIDEAVRESNAGRPVLIGTRTIEASERLSAILHERAVPHEVLNAVRYEEEAAIISRAGAPGWVTIATNMAGRGTDIKLDPRAAEAGGLHVIVCEPHEASRIDRQLFGRAGRQGDPGSARLYVAMDDELLRRYSPLATAMLSRSDGAWRARLGPLLVRWAQRRAQAIAVVRRRDVARTDDWLDRGLGFTGQRH